MSYTHIPVQTKRLGMLEVLFSLPPKDTPRRETPLLFVHGAFAGAWMWGDHFLPWFAQHGYQSYAVSLRGHGGSDTDKDHNYLSVTDYVDDVRACAADIVAQGLPDPALIGHSMGGFVTQKFLEHNYAPAAALVCAVPPQGLMLSQLHMITTRPDLLGEINEIINGGEVHISVVQEVLFSRHVDDKLLERFRANMQIESQRAIWDMSLFNLPLLPRWIRPPLLILGAEEDLLVPPFLVEATALTYSQTAHIFPKMGHAVTHEREWPTVATFILEWLRSLNI
ncbi:MAG: alpha/beta fold hydrolase [Zoogloeaceae bacterium]|jgi:non-heme chloroperoxidase|nr:alpha/beta fold hydrolase [Zoogloeaceae bacterium]